MSSLGVEENPEHVIALHPLDEELGGETLVREDSIALDNLVKVSDTLDPPFQVVRLQAHQGDLEAENLGFLLSFVLGDQSPGEAIYGLNDSVNLLTSHISQALLWGFSQPSFADGYESWSVLSYEFFVVDQVRSANYLH